MRLLKSLKRKKGTPKQKSSPIKIMRVVPTVEDHISKLLCRSGNRTHIYIHLLLSVDKQSYWIPFPLNKSINGIEEMFDFLKEKTKKTAFHELVSNKINKIYGTKGIKSDLIALYKSFLEGNKDVMFITLFGKNMFSKKNSPDTSNDKLIEKMNPTTIDQYNIVLTKCNHSPRRTRLPSRLPSRSQSPRRLTKKTSK